MKYLIGFVFGFLLIVTGCGVPQEEHDATVAKLQAERSDIESSLNEKITELEGIVKAEKAKGKSMRLQLDSTERKLKDGQKKALVAAKELAKIKAQATSLERDIDRAESAKNRVEDELSDVEDQLAAVEIERDEAIKNLEQLRNNMSALSSPQADPSLVNSDETTSLDEYSLDYNESDMDFLSPGDKARLILENMKAK